MTLVPTQEELDRAVLDAPDSFIDVPYQGGRTPLTVICRANTDVSHREKNVATNIARPIFRFLSRPDLMQRRYDPIAVCGGGTSLKRYLDDIRKFKYVMAAGSSHDYLVSEGIIPNFAVSTDSKEETELYYKNPQRGCAYLLASTCPPALFDSLKDYDVQLWHFNEQVDPKCYGNERAIGWGCMVGVVCIQMALWLGFQEHHYFGYDSCLDGYDGHAYPVSDEEQGQIKENITIASCGEEETKYATTTALLCQITHFYGVYRSPDAAYLKGYVYGGGLLWDNIRQSPPEMKQWLEAV